MQPWWTPFPIWNQPVVPCPVLNGASWLAYSFLRRKVRWSDSPISLQFVVIHRIKEFRVVSEAEAEADVFLEFFCFFYDPTDVGNVISSSSAFSNLRLNIWKFPGHILVKPSMENFEHFFASVWDECNCMVIRTFFDLSLGLEQKLTFSVLWQLLSFPNLPAYWVQQFHKFIFKDLK